MKSFSRYSSVVFLLFSFTAALSAAEVIEIREDNFEQIAPDGKEADWIFGDFVLRNDLVTVVIAKPIASRNANMTVRNVAGAVIDFTFRHRPSDQLSCFYPGGAEIPIRYLKPRVDGNMATVTVSSDWRENLPEMEVIYSLKDGETFLTVESTFKNPHQQPISFAIRDSVRADRKFDHVIDGSLYTCEDYRWRQAYGILVEDHEIKPSGDTVDRGRPVLDYERDGSHEVTLQPQETYQLTRKLFVDENAINIRQAALAGDEQLVRVAVSVTDDSGFVPHANVKVSDGNSDLGKALTPAIGPLLLHLPTGKYSFEASDQARGTRTVELEVAGDSLARIELPPAGYVQAKIVDGQGNAIPAKVQFRDKQGDDPNFGDETQSFGVRNLQYTADGIFKAAVAPGEYDIIVSHGPEYDADFQTISVDRGQITQLNSTLKRSVDTTGWVSSDFHSHSSPSGDNTSDQLGRVLNLLAEHIEFAPCTEHNRISTYSPHLKRLQAEYQMATCTGMELTGQPLPINHQNAFPLKRHAHTQDGGGPTTHSNPIVQIERLAMWDNGSDKLLQENHPNLEQIWADQDLDGKEDAGFEKMFGFMDVVEVHPPADIFVEPGSKTGPYGNVIQSWLRMLNKGYRIPGVVNTDAHYNFHGSGWLRNYIKSSTDEPGNIDVMEMVHESEHGHVVMTNGPFLEVTATSGDHEAIPGDDLTAEDGKVSLAIRVQCPNWFDIDRVQLVINGKLSEDHRFTKRETAGKFRAEGAVKFDETVEVTLSEDAHIIVATIGEESKLGPVMGPERGEDKPVALSNPIFVDVDGGGFKPNGDLLGLPFPYVAR